MYRTTKLFFSSLLIIQFTIGHGLAFAKENEVEDQVKPHHTSTGFQNHPFVETAAPKGVPFYLRRFWASVFVPDIPEGHALSGEESINLLNAYKSDKLTWLGHATFLIQLSDMNILTDPFLGEFASPLSWAGPRRFVESGITVENLPPIDLIIVSHNHYDHLDDYTITNIKSKENVQVVVPLGIKPFFEERGYSRIAELDWGDSISVKGIKVTSQGAVHDSARSTSDHNKTLWSSWVLESSQNKVLFVGDSGYSETIFKKIGQLFGNIDYALLPIGAYEPRELMWMSHVTPEEAVKIGLDTGSRALVASHWGTVSSLSDEPVWEPPKRFKKAGLKENFSKENIWIMKVGETRSIRNKLGIPEVENLSDNNETDRHR